MLVGGAEIDYCDDGTLITHVQSLLNRGQGASVLSLAKILRAGYDVSVWGTRVTKGSLDSSRRESVLYRQDQICRLSMLEGFPHLRMGPFEAHR